MFKKFAVLIVAAGAIVTARAQAGMDGRDDRGWSNWTHPTAAPEIDPASAMSAFTLLSGGLVMLRGRRAKK